MKSNDNGLHNDFFFVTIPYRLWEIAVLRGASALLQPSFIYRFSKLYAEEKRICEFLFEYSPKIIQHRLENRLTEIGDEFSNSDNGTKSMIIIDKLLEMERKELIDRQRVHDQINTLIVAVRKA